MVFWVLNPLQVQKNGLIIEKKVKSQYGRQSRLQTLTQNHINWYAILNTVIRLPKQFYPAIFVFVTNQDVYHDNLGIHGLPEAIFKISAVKNNKKPKLGFSITHFLVIICSP